MSATTHDKVNNDDAILEKWCKEWEVPYNFARLLKGTVCPLLEEAHNKSGFRFDKAFLEQKEGTDLRLANSKRILLLLKKLIPENYPADERIVIELHLEYMTTVEGLLAPQINFLVFLLIANGYSFGLTGDGQCARTLRDIEKANFSKKFKFIGRHGFRELSKNKDAILSLRNSAAHMFYEINGKGNIKVGQRKITEEKYAKLYDYLRNVAISLHLLMLLYYRKFASFPSLKLKKIKCVCGYENLVPTVKKFSGNKDAFRCTRCNRKIGRGISSRKKGKG